MITAQLLRVYVYNEDAVLGLLLCLSDVILPEYFSDNMRGLIGDLEIFHVFMHDRVCTSTITKITPSPQKN